MFSCAFGCWCVFGLIDRRRWVLRCPVLSGCCQRCSVSTCVYRSATRQIHPAVPVRAERNCSFYRHYWNSARRVKTSGRTFPSGTRSRWFFSVLVNLFFC